MHIFQQFLSLGIGQVVNIEVNVSTQISITVIPTYTKHADPIHCLPYSATTRPLMTAPVVRLEHMK